LKKGRAQILSKADSRGLGRPQKRAKQMEDRLRRTHPSTGPAASPSSAPHSGAPPQTDTQECLRFSTQTVPRRLGRSRSESCPWDRCFCLTAGIQAKSVCGLGGPRAGLAGLEAKAHAESGCRRDVHAEGEVCRLCVMPYYLLVRSIQYNCLGPPNKGDSMSESCQSCSSTCTPLPVHLRCSPVRRWVSRMDAGVGHSCQPGFSPSRAECVCASLAVSPSARDLSHESLPVSSGRRTDSRHDLVHPRRRS